MKNKILISLLLLFSLNGFASVNDSLLSVFHNSQLEDTTRLKAMNRLAKSYVFTQPDSAIHFAGQELEFAINKKLKLYQAESYQIFGNAYYVKQQIDTSISLYLKSIRLYQEVENQSGMASVHNNIGIMYEIKGEYLNALEHYLSGLAIREKEQRFPSMAKLNLNIGNVYILLKEYDNALKYYSKANYIFVMQKDSANLARTLTAFGLAFQGMNQRDSAYSYFYRAKTIYEQKNDLIGINQCKINIGVLRLKDQEYGEALLLFEQAYDYYRSSGDLFNQATALENMGMVNFHFNNFNKSIEYCTKALEISKKYHIQEIEKSSCRCLYKAYGSSNNPKKALAFYEKYVQISDSIRNENITKQIARTELKYEYDKKMLSDSLERAEAERIKELEYNKKVEQQKTYTYAGIIGALMLLVILAVLFKSYSQKKRSNTMLEEKNELITRQKKEVEIQKHLVEEKSKEITDSIEYARNIQHAILPAMSLFEQHLSDGFVLFQPKDLVSGDFYWMETVRSNGGRVMGNELSNPKAQNPNLKIQNPKPVFFAVADCTGHGVPGAMVSVVCHNALNRAVKEFNITEPAKILDKTRELVIETFAKSNKEVKDGMDIALCSLKTQTTNNKQQTIIQYAGANNPLWIIRPTANCHPEHVLREQKPRGEFLEDTENKELEAYLSLTTDNYLLYEIKGDKQPVGQHPDRKPFTTHTIELQKGDSIYLFTDGFPDQFGGPRNKKLKYKPFMEMLIKHAPKTSDEQRQSLQNEFENWKGNNEQIDDVCILCVKI